MQRNLGQLVEVAFGANLNVAFHCGKLGSFLKTPELCFISILGKKRRNQSPEQSTQELNRAFKGSPIWKITYLPLTAALILN